MTKNLFTLSSLALALLFSTAAHAAWDTDDSGNAGGGRGVQAPNPGNGGSGDFSFDADTLGGTTSPNPTGWSTVSGDTTPLDSTVSQDENPAASFGPRSTMVVGDALGDGSLTKTTMVETSHAAVFKLDELAGGAVVDNGAVFNETPVQAKSAVDNFNWRSNKK